MRDRLTEHSLGALPIGDAAPIDRHLTWCAACRKEAGELQRASATLAFTIAPEDPPADLEARVVGAVHAEASRRSRQPQPAPRRRLVLAAAFAASLAVLGTSWGAVMAERAARSDEAARLEEMRRTSAVERFQAILRTSEFADGDGQVLIGSLEPATLAGGSGDALVLVSASIADRAVVLIDGLPSAPRELRPFTVRLRGDDDVLMVGRLDERDLDDGGSATVMEEFHDLTGYDTIVVRDATGRVVLSGVLQTQADIASPAP
ncbi:MAG TPA: hypothetical protein VNC60_09785 [Actinomycetota bacterium]|nr:hypothetical protein [Actinomycetota bacterium]